MTIQWGGQEGSVSGVFSPTTTSITVPHVYLQTGTYLVQITVSAGGQSTTADVSTTVSHVLAEQRGIFIIGDQNNDQISLDQKPSGAVILTSNLAPSSGLPITIGKARSVYVETLSGNDVITATPRFRSSLWVDAGAGNDFIHGGAGADHLSGGPGNDTISAGTGNDFLYAGSGNDTLKAGRGNDALYAGSGNDRVVGGPGEDQLFGGAGNDTLIAGTGNNFMVGGLGAATLYGGSGKDILIGGYDNAGYEYQPRVVHSIIAAWASCNLKAVTRTHRFQRVRGQSGQQRENRSALWR